MTRNIFRYDRNTVFCIVFEISFNFCVNGVKMDFHNFVSPLQTVLTDKNSIFIGQMILSYFGCSSANNLPPITLICNNQSTSRQCVLLSKHIRRDIMHVREAKSDEAAGTLSYTGWRPRSLSPSNL